MRYTNWLAALVVGFGMAGPSGSFGETSVHMGDEHGRPAARLTQFRARCYHPSHGSGNWVSAWYNTAAEAKTAGDAHTNAYNLEHRCSVEFGNN
jgi:hypothetical protein